MGWLRWGRAASHQEVSLRGISPTPNAALYFLKSSLPNYHPSDDFSPPTLLARSAFPPVSDGGAACFRCAIGRVGDVRHDASVANHALALDFGAAGFPQRVSRVRPPWPRRSPL